MRKTQIQNRNYNPKRVTYATKDKFKIRSSGLKRLVICETKINRNPGN